MRSLGCTEGQAPQLDAPAAGTELVQAHAMLAEHAQAQALSQQVQGDPDLCALATAQLLQGVAGALPAMAEQERQQAQQQAQQELGQRRRQRRQRRQRGPQADPDGALRRALRGAAQQEKRPSRPLRCRLPWRACRLAWAPARSSRPRQHQPPAAG